MSTSPSLGQEQTVYALDSTTIDLCLLFFPWARFRKRKTAVKLHTLLDLQGNIRSFIKITDGKRHNVHILDELISESGSYYVMNGGILASSSFMPFPFASLSSSHGSRRICGTIAWIPNQSTRPTGVRADQTIVLTGTNTTQHYRDKFHRVLFFLRQEQKNLVFLINDFSLPPESIALLYKQRWQVELFFRWIEQHLRVKAFFGTSENAVKTQVWSPSRTTPW